MVKWMVWAGLLAALALWFVMKGLIAMKFAESEDDELDATSLLDTAFEVFKVGILCFAVAEIINRL
jgi:uncharacterized PurR-regulated membrane protein YhhQ (DUF165 family)